MLKKVKNKECPIAKEYLYLTHRKIYVNLHNGQISACHFLEMISIKM